jgi:hypothetical protein
VSVRLDPEIGSRHPRYSPSLGETGLARDEDGNVVWTIRTILFRIEIGAALQPDIPVVPILVDAKVPNADQLPKILKSFHSGMS